MYVLDVQTQIKPTQTIATATATNINARDHEVLLAAPVPEELGVLPPEVPEGDPVE